MNTDHMEWREIIENDNYEVSNTGLIRRSKSGKGTNVGLILKASTDQNGYKRVYLCRDGTERTIYVHRCVAFAFLGCPKPNQEVNHIDGNPSNNLLDNLEWCSHSENISHAHRMGFVSVARGEVVGSSRLTADQVNDIRTRRRFNETNVEIANDLCVSKSTIGDVILGKTWRWL